MSSYCFNTKLEPEWAIFFICVSDCPLIIKFLNEDILGEFGWNIDVLVSAILLISTNFSIVEITSLLICGSSFSKSEPLARFIIVTTLLTLGQNHFEVSFVLMFDILKSIKLCRWNDRSTTVLTLHFLKKCWVILIDVVSYEWTESIWVGESWWIWQSHCSVCSSWFDILLMLIPITFKSWNSDNLSLIWTSSDFYSCKEILLMIFTINTISIHDSLDREGNSLWLNNICFDIHCENLLHANAVVMLNKTSWITSQYVEVL